MIALQAWRLVKTLQRHHSQLVGKKLSHNAAHHLSAKASQVSRRIIHPRPGKKSVRSMRSGLLANAFCPWSFQLDTHSSVGSCAHQYPQVENVCGLTRACGAAMYDKHSIHLLPQHSAVSQCHSISAKELHTHLCRQHASGPQGT